MRALYIIVPALCILVIAYRYYSAFIAAKLWVLDDMRVTPAHTKNDGANYFPTSKWVLFGHHFAAIAGAGPLVGPVLAAQFAGAGARCPTSRAPRSARSSGSPPASRS
jgi:carbon starvation protein